MIEDTKFRDIHNGMLHELHECSTIDQVRDVIIRVANDMKPLAWDEGGNKSDPEKLLIYRHIDTLQVLCEVLGKWKGF